MAHSLSGLLLGALIGGLLGLAVWTLIIGKPVWFPGDTIVAGALICGTLGYVVGEDFIEWLKENWWWPW